ncbi:pyridoxal phosphate-dependent aminotransferase [Panacibacter ginsenosidivorans]|uniref:Aminotransferase n=1 Tax=Panacibacter ginsenosidivorans TaxID=1813871 RepID=A0A5B8V5L7_9BACT|nr:pyridoxal phosphate-dependent aminotransferase [Panacibacter ginsenosidivorans]QEC66365.1 pyridoxal phosphate-dependent aminotransferase [Panacibacter ginsenosidivorans]
MHYKRMPIEIEAPEGYGYENIDCNLSESSFTDQRLSDLGIDINDLVLFYGDHMGKPALREIITANNNLNAGDVLITPGAAPALFIVATALLEKGDHVVVAKSNYATNIETPRAIGANISYLKLHFENGYKLDIDELESLITNETKFVSLTYPHNPTGTLIDEATLKKVITIIEKKNTYLLFDETYRDMSFAPQLPVGATLSERVISVSSMSKSYGLPGIRIGWLICRDKQLMETFLAAKEQIFITNSVIDEEIAYQYLYNKEKFFAPVKETILKNFLVLKNFMQQQNMLEWIEPQGGCVCFPRIRKDIAIDTAQFHEVLLNKYSTYVGRGHWFEEDGRYMRIGYSWDKTEKLQKGLNNILKAINDTRK